RRSAGAPGKPARSSHGAPRGAAQHPRERSVPRLLPMDRRGPRGRRDRGLPLKERTMRKVPYPAPGEILLEEFLKPMGITQYRLAKEIGVPQRRIGEIVAGTRAITPDTGLRLSRFFAMSDGFW